MRQPNHGLCVFLAEAIYLHERSNTHSKLSQSMWMRCAALRLQTIDYKRCLSAPQGRALSRPAKKHGRGVDALSLRNILKSSVENDEVDTLTIQFTIMTAAQQHRGQCTCCFLTKVAKATPAVLVSITPSASHRRHRVLNAVIRSGATSRCDRIRQRDWITSILRALNWIAMPNRPFYLGGTDLPSPIHRSCQAVVTPCSIVHTPVWTAYASERDTTSPQR